MANGGDGTPGHQENPHGGIYVSYLISLFLLLQSAEETNTGSKKSRKPEQRALPHLRGFHVPFPSSRNRGKNLRCQRRWKLGNRWGQWQSGKGDEGGRGGGALRERQEAVDILQWLGDVCKGPGDWQLVLWACYPEWLGPACWEDSERREIFKNERCIP